jgi:uncharacterized protein (DUF2336 family)
VDAAVRERPGIGSSRASLICEVEEAIGSRSSAVRMKMLRRVTDLFLGNAAALAEDGVGVFDDVIGRLADAMEEAVRAELASRLAPVPNAPVSVVKALAEDDSATVAAPVLAQSPRLSDEDLVHIASRKGQQHLLAISTRNSLSEAVTDMLVTRGDNTVVRSVAGNDGARLSEHAFTVVVARSRGDDGLAETLGLRPDLPKHHLKELLAAASADVRARLMSAVPGVEADVGQILDRLSTGIQQMHDQAEPAGDVRTVEAMHREGRLSESDIAAFALAGKFAETAMSLSLLSGVPLDGVTRAMRTERPDMLFMLTKTAGLHWDATKAIYLLQMRWRRIPVTEVEHARRAFIQLQGTTAQRIVAFIRARQAAMNQVSGIRRQEARFPTPDA